VSAGLTADLRNLVRPTRETPAIGLGLLAAPSPLLDWNDKDLDPDDDEGVNDFDGGTAIPHAAHSKH
jgi:hypothetical protein